MHRNFTVIVSILAAASSFVARADPRPADIVDLHSVDASIVVEMMYFTTNNFVGRPIQGYRANVCLLTKPAAEALRSAQRRLRADEPDLTLVLRDCYRPRKSVAHFLEWVRRPDQLEMKEQYYPDLTKQQILDQGYLAPVSGHSRASTVDLTIGRRKPSGEIEALPMGTRVDFFGERSHTDFPGISEEERRNRRRLLVAMGTEYRNYPKEWWHFTLKSEPYPKTGFDFDVE